MVLLTKSLFIFVDQQIRNNLIFYFFVFLRKLLGEDWHASASANTGPLLPDLFISMHL